MEDTGILNEFADSSYREEDTNNVDSAYAVEMEVREEEEMREESMEEVPHISEDE